MLVFSIIITCLWFATSIIFLTFAHIRDKYNSSLYWRGLFALSFSGIIATLFVIPRELSILQYIIILYAITRFISKRWLIKKLKKKIPSASIPWKIDQSIDVCRISLEDVKLIFGQAEKRLDDTVKTGETIASKTMTLMTIMVGILVALCGFFISNWKGLREITSKDYVTLIGLVYIIGLFAYMMSNVMPNKYYVLGSEPSELMTPNFFAPEIDKDRITVFLYMSEIENYDFRIERNLHVNTIRWEKYRYSVIALFLLPAILGLVYMGCNG